MLVSTASVVALNVGFGPQMSFVSVGSIFNFSANPLAQGVAALSVAVSKQKQKAAELEVDEYTPLLPEEEGHGQNQRDIPKIKEAWPSTMKTTKMRMTKESFCQALAQVHHLQNLCQQATAEQSKPIVKRDYYEPRDYDDPDYSQGETFLARKRWIFTHQWGSEAFEVFVVVLREDVAHFRVFDKKEDYECFQREEELCQSFCGAAKHKVDLFLNRHSLFPNHPDIIMAQKFIDAIKPTLDQDDIVYQVSPHEQILRGALRSNVKERQPVGSLRQQVESFLDKRTKSLSDLQAKYEDPISGRGLINVGDRIVVREEFLDEDDSNALLLEGMHGNVVELDKIFNSFLVKFDADGEKGERESWIFETDREKVERVATAAPAAAPAAASAAEPPPGSAGSPAAEPTGEW